MKIWEIFRLFISFEISKNFRNRATIWIEFQKKEIEEKYNFIFERILIKCYLYKHLNHWKFLIDLSISLNEVYLYVSNIDLKFISSIFYLAFNFLIHFVKYRKFFQWEHTILSWQMIYIFNDIYSVLSNKICFISIISHYMFFILFYYYSYYISHVSFHTNAICNYHRSK